MKKSRKRAIRRGAQRFVLLLCALVMLASAAYLIYFELNRRAILRGNAEFSALYLAPSLEEAAGATFAPDFAPAWTPLVTRAPATARATSLRRGSSPTASVLPAPSVSPTPSPLPTATPAPKASPSPSPSPTASPEPTFEIVVDATRTPRATADAETLVVAMETPPPVQQSFSGLLAANADAVGFLTIDDLIRLPVVQRANDNDYYLNHSFDGALSNGGTLFLDGSNLLTPEDDCLIVYGHNMKNGTMFRPLVQYEKPSFLKQHPLVQFDTIYENRVWAPFAALTVTADPGSERYLNLRQFSFDAPSFDRFVHSLRTLSLWDSPVEIEYGDKLLLLVTCEYTHDNGRFVLALRATREAEPLNPLRSQIQKSN